MVLSLHSSGDFCSLNCRSARMSKPVREGEAEGGKRESKTKSVGLKAGNVRRQRDDELNRNKKERLPAKYKLVAISERDRHAKTGSNKSV